MYTESSKIVGFGSETEIDIEELYTAPDSIHAFEACEGFTLESLGALLETSDNIANSVIESIQKKLDTIEDEEALEAYVEKFNNIKNLFNEPVKNIKELNSTMEPGSEAYVAAMESALSQIAFVKNMLGIGESDKCTIDDIKTCSGTLNAMEGVIANRVEGLKQEAANMSKKLHESFMQLKNLFINFKSQFEINSSDEKNYEAKMNEVSTDIDKFDKGIKTKSAFNKIKSELLSLKQLLNSLNHKMNTNKFVAPVLCIEGFESADEDADIATESKSKKDDDDDDIPPKEGIEDDRVMKPVDHDILTKTEFALAINVAQDFDAKEEKGESVPKLGKGVKWKDVVLGIHKGHYTVNALCDLAGGQVFCRDKNKKLALKGDPKATEMYKFNGSYIANEADDLDENGQPKYEAILKADKYAKESAGEDVTARDKISTINKMIADAKIQLNSKNYGNVGAVIENARRAVSELPEEMREKFDKQLDQLQKSYVTKDTSSSTIVGEASGSKSNLKKRIENYIEAAENIYKEDPAAAYEKLACAQKEIDALGDSAGAETLKKKWLIINKKVATYMVEKGTKGTESLDHIEDEIDDIAIDFDDDNDPDIASLESYLEGFENILNTIDPELITAIESLTEAELIDLEVALEAIEGMSDDEISDYIAEEGVTDKVKRVIENVQVKRHAKKHGVSLNMAKIERAYDAVGKAVKAFDHPLKTKNIMIMQTAFKVLTAIGGILAAGTIGYTVIKKVKNAAKGVDSAKNAVSNLKTETSAASVVSKKPEGVTNPFNNIDRYRKFEEEFSSKMSLEGSRDLKAMSEAEVKSLHAQAAKLRDNLMKARADYNEAKANVKATVDNNREIEALKKVIKNMQDSYDKIPDAIKKDITKEGYETTDMTEDMIATESAAAAGANIFGSITAGLNALSGSSYASIVALGVGAAGSAIAKKLGGSEEQEREIINTVEMYKKSRETVNGYYQDIDKLFKDIKAKGEPVDPSDVSDFVSKARSTVNIILAEYKSLNVMLKSLIKSAKKSGNTLENEEKALKGATASFSEFDDEMDFEPSYESYYEGYNNIYCYLDNEELEGLESFTTDELFDLEMALEALLFTDLETDDILDMIAEEGKLKDKVEKIATKRQAKKQGVSLTMAKVDRSYAALQKALKSFEYPLKSNNYKKVKTALKVLVATAGIVGIGIGAKMLADSEEFFNNIDLHNELVDINENLERFQDNIASNKDSITKYKEKNESLKTKLEELYNERRELNRKYGKNHELYEATVKSIEYNEDQLSHNEDMIRDLENSIKYWEKNLKYPATQMRNKDNIQSDITNDIRKPYNNIIKTILGSIGAGVASDAIVKKFKNKLEVKESIIKNGVEQYQEAYKKARGMVDEVSAIYTEIKQNGDPVDSDKASAFISKCKSCTTIILASYESLRRTLKQIIKSAKKHKTSIEEEAKIQKKLSKKATESLSNVCIIEELELIKDDLFLNGECINATEAYDRLTEVSEAMEALLNVIHTIEDPDERLELLDWYENQRPGVLAAIESLTEVEEDFEEELNEEDIVTEEAEESFIDITDFVYEYDPAVEAAMADKKDSWVINFNSLHAQIVNSINTASNHIKSHSIKEAKDSLNTAAHACRETLGNIKELTKEKFLKFSKRSEVSDGSFETFRKLKTQEVQKLLDRISEIRNKINGKGTESFVTEAYNEYLRSMGLDEDGNLLDDDEVMNAAIEAKVELESERFDALCNLELAIMEIDSEECP